MKKETKINPNCKSKKRKPFLYPTASCTELPPLARPSPAPSSASLYPPTLRAPCPALTFRCTVCAIRSQIQCNFFSLSLWFFSLSFSLGLVEIENADTKLKPEPHFQYLRYTLFRSLCRLNRKAKYLVRNFNYISDVLLLDGIDMVAITDW